MSEQKNLTSTELFFFLLFVFIQQYALEFRLHLSLSFIAMREYPIHPTKYRLGCSCHLEGGFKRATPIFHKLLDEKSEWF